MLSVLICHTGLKQCMYRFDYRNPLVENNSEQRLRALLQIKLK